ncbi:unnamed protein product, partial [Ascophyllum nodosum]
DLPRGRGFRQGRSILFRSMAARRSLGGLRHHPGARGWRPLGEGCVQRFCRTRRADSRAGE